MRHKFYNFTVHQKGYGKSYYDLKNEVDKLQQRYKQLQNNWNELKKWLEDKIEHNVDGIKSYCGYQCKETLNKMQELEQGKDE